MILNKADQNCYDTIFVSSVFTDLDQFDSIKFRSITEISKRPFISILQMLRTLMSKRRHVNQANDILQNDAQHNST